MIRTRPHWRKHHSIPRIVFVTALLLLFPLRNARADSIYANAGSAIVAIDPGTGPESTLNSAPSGFQGISTFDVVGRRLLYTTSTGTGTALVSVNIDARTVTELALPHFYAFVEFDAVSEIPAMSPILLVLLSLTLGAIAAARLTP